MSPCSNSFESLTCSWCAKGKGPEDIEGRSLVVLRLVSPALDAKVMTVDTHPSSSRLHPVPGLTVSLRSGDRDGDQRGHALSPPWLYKRCLQAKCCPTSASLQRSQNWKLEPKWPQRTRILPHWRVRPSPRRTPTSGGGRLALRPAFGCTPTSVLPARPQTGGIPTASFQR